MSTGIFNSRGDAQEKSKKINRDAIALRAYELWLDAGQPTGRDLDFWFQAEAELLGSKPGGPASGAPKLRGNNYSQKRKTLGSCNP